MGLYMYMYIVIGAVNLKIYSFVWMETGFNLHYPLVFHGFPVLLAGPNMYSPRKTNEYPLQK